MRIALLMPGTGSFYCGTCIRDNTLARALREPGHEVVLVPLYLPLKTEWENTSDENPIFFGGVHVYLKHRFRWLRSMPRWLERWLDRETILRFAARHQRMTEPTGLVDLTLSMLAGLDGGQAADLHRLTQWIKTHVKPDVICLSNALLLGCARALRTEVGCPIVCTLQGEHAFVEPLPEHHQTEIWNAMGACTDDVDLFIAVSAFFKEKMRVHLDLSPKKIAVIHNGIDLNGYAVRETPPDPPVIGFLARMSPEKGLDLLIDAFVLLRQHEAMDGVQLRLAGAMNLDDRDFVQGLKTHVKNLGLESSVSFHPNVSPQEKRTFMQNLSVLAVPGRQPEAFGLYLIEAMASGVPVVAPRLGACPEIMEATGGGLLCEPNDPQSLADTLHHMLSDQTRMRSLGEAGLKMVQERFHGNEMAKNFLRHLQPLVGEQDG